MKEKHDSTTDGIRLFGEGDSRLSMTEKCISSNGISLQYYRTGGEHPPLVLAHGITDNGLVWLPVARETAPRYDTIMYDARGHGKSDAPERGYETTDRVNDLHGLIRGLSLDKPLLLGHSMGAVTVLAYAAMHPDVPAAAVLEDPPLHLLLREDASQPGRPRQNMERRRATIAKMHGQSIEEVAKNCEQEHPGWTREDVLLYAEAKKQASTNICNRGEPNAIDWPSLLREISCPMLLITADNACGAIVTDGQAQRLKGLIPHMSRAHLEGAGHCIRRERFEAYMEAVLAFFKTARGNSNESGKK